MAPQAEANGMGFAVETMAGTSPTLPTRGVTRRSPQSKSQPVMHSCTSPSTISLEMTGTTPPQQRRRRRRIRSSSERTMHYRSRVCAVVLALFGVMFLAIALRFRSNRHQSQSENLRASRDVFEDGNSSTRWDETLEEFAPNENAVQVILTRFMQHQPDLATLGMARLKIFETFCFPTVIGQSSKSFLWIIRIDPALNATLRQGLLDLVEPYPNFLVVASNENPEGFRSEIAVADIVSRDKESNNNILSGSEELLWRYHDAAQHNIVLESRLDADDGLHANFVQYMQGVAPHDGLVLAEKTSSWNVWCAFSHLEWQYSSPFRHLEDAEEGYFVGIKNVGCITPGLTFVYGVTASRDNLPAGKHSMLHSTVRACKPHKGIVTDCLYKFEELMPGAIRARTPTSAGMANVHISTRHNKHLSKAYKNAEPQAELQDDLWRGVAGVFGIQREKAVETRSYIASHLSEIALENLKGQCTAGHSCKNESKAILHDLLKVENSTKEDAVVA